jgi:hypothetical protein
MLCVGLLLPRLRLLLPRFAMLCGFGLLQPIERLLRER